MPPTFLIKGSLIPPINASKELVKKYQDNLPIDIVKEWITERMPERGGKIAKSPSDRILIVRAKTGSGKSTAMPVELFKILKPTTMKTYSGPGILITQPRILTSQEIALELSQASWANLELNKTIGYSTGSGKETFEKGFNGILYATIGTLLQQLKQPDARYNIMKNHRIIILDEVHERSMEFDMTVMLMKKYIYDYYEDRMCPFLILTSATFDVEKYCKYLGISPKTNLFDVAGSVFPISDDYLEVSSDNITQSTLETVVKIHEEKVYPMKAGEHDIMIFCYGASQIKPVKEALLKYNVELIKEKKKCFLITVVEGVAVRMNTIERRLVYYDYDKLTVNDAGEYDFKGKHKAYRRIIIATNAAETGLTVATLGFCIDMGFKQVNEIYNPYDISGIIAKPVDQNNVKQRRGRVGRKFLGHFFAMYTEETYNMLTPIQLPSIVLEDISSTIINILIQQNNCFDLDKIDMLDTPTIDSLKVAIEKNIVLGYIKSDYGKCFVMSELGEIYRNIRYSTIEEFRCFISAYVYDVCISDIITMFSMNEVRMRKVKVNDILKESLPAFFFKDTNYMDFYTAITMDDFITKLFVFDAFMKITKKGITVTENWCEKNGININEMIFVIQRRLNLMNDLIDIKYDPFYKKDESITLAGKDNYFSRLCGIKKCLYDGYLLNILRNDREARGYISRFGLKVRVNLPNREIGFPKYVITNKIKIAGQMGETFNYKLEAGNICVLDGYVSFDSQFLTSIQDLDYKSKIGDLSTLLTGNDSTNKIENYNAILKTNDDLVVLASKKEKYADIIVN